MIRATMATSSPDLTPVGWDRAAAHYNRTIPEFTGQYAREAIRIAGIGPGERVLDVATGPGTAALLAAEVGADVVATDFSPAMIEALRARIASAGVEGVEALVMDGQQLKLEDGSFDVALSVFGVMFFPDRHKGLSELHRVLRPGGRACIVTWCEPRLVPVLSLFGEYARRAIPDLPPPDGAPAVFSLPTPARVGRELQTAGFRDVRVEPIVGMWVSESPQAFWDELAYATPVFSALLERIGDRAELVQKEAMTSLAERFGDDPVELPNVALVGLGYC